MSQMRKKILYVITKSNWGADEAWDASAVRHLPGVAV
ncbi:MAG: hypothetical protein RLZZ234_388 [Candidatus Parcubacteria bacterium]